MRGTEIFFSVCLIEKIGRRLSHQRSVVAAIDKEADPSLHASALQLVSMFEDKLTAAQQVHEEILDDLVVGSRSGRQERL